MIHDVHYNGYTAAPSDYSSKDGDMDMAFNLIPEDGELKPIQQPRKVQKVADGISVVYLHITNTGTNYIVKNETPLIQPEDFRIGYTTDMGYLSKIDTIQAMPGTQLSNRNIAILSFNSVGNTLLVNTDNGIYYYLWKDNQYKCMGNHMPELQLSFSLEGTLSEELDCTFNTGVGFVTSQQGSLEGTFPEDFVFGDQHLNIAKAATETFLAEANKLVSKETKNGKFVFPFLVRYAYRLFDDTLTMHSAPVLMITDSWISPQILVTQRLTVNEFISGFVTKIRSMVFDLSYNVESSLKTRLQQWDDIVKSVDIFVSAPLYTYNQSGNVTGWHTLNEEQLGYSISALRETKNSVNHLPTGYKGKYWKYHVSSNLTTHYADFSGRSQSGGITEIMLPRHSEEDISKAVRSCANLYLLTSVKIEDLAVKDSNTERQRIQVPKGYLEALTSREVMTDDYDSHDILKPGSVHLYNSRLHIANISKQMANPYTPPAYVNMSNHTWSKADETAGSSSWYDKGSAAYKIYVYIKQDFKHIVMAYNDNEYNMLGCPDNEYWEQVDTGTTSVWTDGMYYTAGQIVSIVLNNNLSYFVVRQDHTANASNKPDILQNAYWQAIPDWKEGMIYPRQGFVSMTVNRIRLLFRAKKIHMADSYNNPVNPTTFPFVYFFYPNTHAYKVVFESIVNNESTYYEIPLTPHDFLNGAVFFEGYNPRYRRIYTSPSISESQGINMKNKLYVSEAGNPFLFPVTGICTIGSGTIMALKSASRALSQGQFGQFPLYAFCSDGVWALSVSATGGYAAIQPVTRDVLTHRNGLISTDNEVLFATERGIMLLSGSNSSCITDSITSANAFDLYTTLPHAPYIQQKMQDTAMATNYIKIKTIWESVKDIRMIYDYIHQHIIFFSATNKTALVYSIKSRQWGMTYSDITAGINSYPTAMAMDRDNCIVSFSDSRTARTSCMLVTRPLKLGQPDTLKTITTLIQRGRFEKGHLNTVLYGSRDLSHWYLIASCHTHILRHLHGTPYKYFRIAAVANLSAEESIAGATIEFSPRQTNQLR